MLRTNKIYLRLMELKDVTYKVEWINNNKVNRTLNFEFPISIVNTENWVRNTANKGNRKDFIVCDIETNLPIGYAGLLQIDFINKKSETYLGIGNTDYWGRGIGLEIKYLLCEYAFDYLNLEKVYSYHHNDNYSMIRINEKLGGKTDNVLRKDLHLPNNIIKDRIIMSILKDEFKRNL